MAYDPVIGTNPYIGAMETRRGHIEQLRQNTSRQATSFNTAISEGSGMMRLADTMEFFCTFIHQPTVSYGYSVLNGGLDDDDMPASTGGVFRWKRDTRGFYVSCNVFVVVTSAKDFTLQHDFTFTGIAMKALPDYLLDF